MSENKKPSDWIKIPPCIRYNKDLKFGARLLYGEIVNLCHKKGYCWAGNSFFCDLYKISTNTVTAWISSLHDLGYVQVENGEGKKRKITLNLTENLIENGLPSGPISKKEGLPSSEKGLPSSEKGLPSSMNHTENCDHIIINNTKINNIKINNKNNTTVPLDNKSKKIFGKLPETKQNEISNIFDFWNEYKKSGIWKKHIRLTSEMIEVILENLKKYSLNDICLAIDNYAGVLQNDESFWTHVWPLSIFLSVKVGPAKDAYKKWWKFLPENFVPESYIKHDMSQSGAYQNKSKSNKPFPKDLDPELTKLLTEKYKKLFINRRDKDFPNLKAQEHFILTTIKAKKKYKLVNTTQKTKFVREFYNIVINHWSGKGETVFPWYLSGTLMWDYLMPQYYILVGIPEECIGNFNGPAEGSKSFEEIIAEEEELTTNIGQNLQKHNPEFKVISDTDDPDFDYIRNI